MIFKKVPQLWKNFLIGIVIAFLPIFFIDNWLPYALLSHYNYPVDSQPAIFQEFNAKVENINFTISAFADLNKTIAKQVPWLPSFWRKRAIIKAEEIAKFSIAEISPINQIAI